MSELIHLAEQQKKIKYVSLNEAMLFNSRVLRKWKPSSDVWPFKYGDDVLGCLTVVSTFITTHFFRKQLKIRPYATLSCYMPVMAIGAFGCHAFNSYVITCDVLQANSCSLCISTKASIAQVLIGTVYPLIAAPVTCFYVADRLLTYPVPPLMRAPKEVFSLFSRLVQKNPRQFVIMGAIHMLAAAFVSNRKVECWKNLEFHSKQANKEI